MMKSTQPLYLAVRLESEDRKIWLPLPATKKQFAAALESIGAENGNFSIAEYTGRVPGLGRKILSETPLSVVNHLAYRLSRLTDEDIVKLCAIFDTDYWFDTAGQIIDYSFATDSYTLLPGVTDAEALGRYYVGDSGAVAACAKLKECIDRREFGKRLAEKEKGAFSPHGYVTSKIGWDLPEKERRVPGHLNLKGWLGEELYEDWEADHAYA